MSERLQGPKSFTRLDPPEGVEPVGIVASIPHTGTHIPASVSGRLADDRMRLQPMCDWHLHHLYEFLPSLGIPVVHATWSRFVADLNRPPLSAQPEPSLYPGRFETGIVPLETFWGDTIWREPPSQDEIAAWARQVHGPYHEALAELLDETVQQHGRAVLIDCHSVRSVANRIHQALADDIYLGDRDGRSCQPWLRETLQQGFTERGLKVAVNAPYKGGYITRHYGECVDVEAIQIEMCQRVYMDEDDPSTATGLVEFNRTRELLQDLFVELIVTAVDRT